MTGTLFIFVGGTEDAHDRYQIMYWGIVYALDFYWAEVIHEEIDINDVVGDSGSNCVVPKSISR